MLDTHFPQAVLAKLQELNVHVTRSEQMGPHMTKYYLSNWWVVHHFTAADTGLPHNHPFSFETEILAGTYTEVVFVTGHLYGDPVQRYQFTHGPGSRRQVRGDTIHLLTEVAEGGCWTIINPGHKEREWGFFRFESDGTWFRQHDRPDFERLAA